MPLRLLLTVMVACFVLPFAAQAQSQSTNAKPRWAIYYGAQVPAADFMYYELVVFDSQQHPPLSPLKQRGITLLGVLQLGDADASRPYFKSLQQQHLLLLENPDWPGRQIIDIRRPEWRAMVLDELIPFIIRQGFDGLMLNMLDAPLRLEKTNKEAYSGMHDAALELVQAIRARYPQIHLMLGGAPDLLPDLRDIIDSAIIDGIYTQHDNKRKQFSLRPEADYKEQLMQLSTFTEGRAKPRLYSLDYWKMEDEKGVKAIYDAQRSNGLIPYVATVDLQNLYPEPR